MKLSLAPVVVLIASVVAAPVAEPDATLEARQSNVIDFNPSPDWNAWCTRTLSVRWLCSPARQLYAEATTEAIRRYGGAGLANGKSDAFRICYWNALMNNQDRFRKDRAAEQIATYYINTSDRTEEEKNMDLRAASSGRSWGTSILPGVQNLKTHLQNGCVHAMNHPIHPLPVLNSSL